MTHITLVGKVYHLGVSVDVMKLYHVCKMKYIIIKEIQFNIKIEGLCHSFAEVFIVYLNVLGRFILIKNIVM